MSIHFSGVVSCTIHPPRERRNLHVNDSNAPQRTFSGTRFPPRCRSQPLERINAILLQYLPQLLDVRHGCCWLLLCASFVDQQVVFLQPVDVGDLVKLDACVLYTKEG